MGKSSLRLSVSRGPADEEAVIAPASSLRRDIALAVTVAALLLMGMAIGGTFAPQPEPIVAAQSAPAAEPTQEFVYFPSQYVNQGVEIPEQIPTF